MTTETNKLKHLNFILIKELRESKTEITILKQEREVNKTIIKQLKDENGKLKAENVSLLKNHHSSSVDLGKVDIKKEDIKKEIENQESARENFKNQKNSENISSPFYNFQEDKTTRNKKTSELQNLTHTCEYCYNSFRSLATLNRHIKKIHIKKKVQKLSKKGKNKGFETQKCEFCGNFFATRASLKLHLNTHKTDKIFKCDYAMCEKSFVAESRLKRHRREVHEGKTEKKCGFCGKKFSRGDILKVHIYTIHEDHKDFKCEYCDKSFKQRSSLNGHCKRHH